MPNWCYNTIVVTGDKKSINTILTKLSLLDDRDGIMEELIGLGDIDKQSYTTGDTWYNWNIGRFGTKWDVPKSDFMGNLQIDSDDEEDSGFTTSFDTAWSPPVPFLGTLSEIYNVSITLDAEEGGNDFYVRAVFNNGHIEELDEMTYDAGHYCYNEDYFWDSVVQNQIEYWCDEDEKPDMKMIEERFDYASDEHKKRILDYWKIEWLEYQMRLVEEEKNKQKEKV